MKGNVLIIEDDQEINQLLQVVVKKLGLSTVSAYSGSEGLLQAEKQAFDLILLDLMLPGVDGETVLASLHQTQQAAIIIISAKKEVENKVALLRQGADDYITKPFAQEEVAARIEVQLRKQHRVKNRAIKDWRQLSLDQDKLLVTIAGHALNVTNAEFDILAFLLENPERALSKREIYEKVWKGTYVGDDNTISVHMSNLRKKIAAVTSEEYIKTVWGIGFMLV